MVKEKYSIIHSIFKNESDIGTALYDWRSNDYNCHHNITRNRISINSCVCLHNC